MRILPILLIISLIAAFPQQNIAQNHQEIGILVLAHGGTEAWNNLVNDAMKSVSEKYPLAVAFGMADPRTLEQGIRELEAQKVSQIIVVPLFISSHSFIIRQTEYFLGKRSELADPLILMDHSGGSNQHKMHQQNNGEMEKTVPSQIKSVAEIVIAKALDDHDLVAAILNKRIKALSENPARESILIVGHGPNPEEDNQRWLSDMESLGEKIRKLNAQDGIEYKNINCLTVRDDASKEIYEMAKENLRSMIRQLSGNSRVIVIPLLLSRGGIEKGIVERMEGLDYVWSGETLLPDPLITDFVIQSVENASAAINSKTHKE